MPISIAECCDCMEFMSRYEDKFFELAIVDPPYGINVAKMAYTQEENRPCKQKNGSILRVKKSKYKHGDWDKTPPNIHYFNELKRVSKHQIIWGWDYFNIDWGHGLIKWNKLVPEGVSFNKSEFAFCSKIDEVIEFNFLWTGFSQGISLRLPTTQKGNKKLNDKRIHPTQKPTALYQWLLHNYAKPNDKILDTHLGSGSSRIAAYKLGFDFWATEIDKDYFEAQEKRFKEAIAQPLFDNPLKLAEQTNMFG